MRRYKANVPGAKDVAHAFSVYAGFKQREKETDRNYKLNERFMSIREAAEKRAQGAVKTPETGMDAKQLETTIGDMPGVGMPTQSGSSPEEADAATAGVMDAAKDAGGMSGNLSTPIPLTQLKSKDFAVMKAKVENYEKSAKIPGLAKSLGQFTNRAKNLTLAQGYNRHQTFLTLTDEWNSLKQGSLDVIQKAINRADAEGDEEQVEILSQTYDAYDSGQVVKNAFSASNRYEEALQAAKIKDVKEPTSINQALAITYKNQPAKLEELFTKMNKRGGGTQKIPNHIKVALDTLKVLKKDQLSVQDKMLMKFMGIDAPETVSNEDKQLLADSILGKITNYLKVEMPKPKKTDKPSWKDHQ